MYNKDIKLKSLENGEYDREFYINDFKTVQNLDSIKNSIIIALMTRLGELNHNPTYNNFGCGAWSYLKQNNTELAKITIQEEIINTIMKIKEIENITPIQIEPHPQNPYLMNVIFTVTLVNGTTNNIKLELGGI